MVDPQVTVGFNTKSWSSMTWMISAGTPMTEETSIYSDMLIYDLALSLALG